jgi:hypothetical protein
MTDKSLAKRIFAILTIAVCSCLLTAGLCPADDASDADNDSEGISQGQTLEMQKRVEASVREVNEEAITAREKAEAVKREQYMNELHEVPAGSLLSQDELDAIETQRKNREKAVHARAGIGVEVTEESGDNVPEAQPGVVQPGEPHPRPIVAGTVTGIVYYNNVGAALLLGDIVLQNDVVRGVKVLRVTPDFVEFEKQGKKWRQLVGQSPPAAVWDLPKAKSSPQPAPVKKK